MKNVKKVNQAEALNADANFDVVDVERGCEHLAQLIREHGVTGKASPLGDAVVRLTLAVEKVQRAERLARVRVTDPKTVARTKKLVQRRARRTSRKGGAA